MSEQEFEQLLQDQLAEVSFGCAQALSRAADGLPAHQPSLRHQRRMARLLRDPLVYARRHGLPPLRQALRTAAMILVTLGLTGTVLLSIPQVRAAVWNFIRTVYETHTEYRFTAPAPEEPVRLPTYHANWLPEGYEETVVRNTASEVLIQYQNEASNMIILRYSVTTKGNAFSVDNEHTSETTITFNGITYTSFFNEETGWRSLTWFSEDRSVFYQLDGFCTIEELVKIKENLS